MNNTEQHGSEPITQLKRIDNTIELYKKYFDEQYPSDNDDSCGDVLPKIDQYKWNYYNSLILLSSILTASKCDTIEQVIAKLQHP